MKWSFMMVGFLLYLPGAQSQAPDFSKYPVYKANDLGLSYQPRQSLFRVWAPTATQLELKLYAAGSGGEPLKSIPMKKAEAGTWTAVAEGDWKNRYYTFRARFPEAGDGAAYWSDEVPDPYARAVGVNGKRAQVIDLRQTHPPGWDKDLASPLPAKTDAVLYELHVRDASIATNSGIQAKGKFAGLTEKDTRNTAGLSTGLDHLKELGVTHVHLLPVYDYHSVDESDTDTPRYNWGYDPLNYNTPEGSYASNAEDGAVRIREFKELVQAFHRNGLRVVMDVVYNHTALTEKSNFNQLVPGYFYRQNKEGGFSDATACGNETASERPMMRKFMIESLLYWVKEYHVDGFRFDLMGVHDIETMNQISRELHALRPDILLYGEGWTAGASPLADSLRALKANASKLDRIAVFSDDLRDGVKGSVFEHADKGFASGKPGMEESVKFGIVASTRHPQVDYSKVNYSKAPYAASPSQTVTYVECHDNHTLWDKLNLSAAPNSQQDVVVSDLQEMHRLALSIVLTSQGIPFLHAGTEFLRSKQGEENSYKSPDAVNALDWDKKTENREVFDYVRQLIAMRKAHPAFRMTQTSQLQQHLRFLDKLPVGVIGYELDGAAVKDSWSRIQVWFNGSGTVQEVAPGKTGWQVAVRHNRFEAGEKAGTTISLQPYSCSILFQSAVR